MPARNMMSHYKLPWREHLSSALAVSYSRLGYLCCWRNGDVLSKSSPRLHGCSHRSREPIPIHLQLRSGSRRRGRGRRGRRRTRVRRRISRSMNRPEQELQRAGYVTALKSPEFLDALQASPLGKVAIAYVEWSAADDQEVLLNWTLIDSAQSVGAAADKLAAAPYERLRERRSPAASIFRYSNSSLTGSAAAAG